MFACYDVKSPAYLEYIPERDEINKKKMCEILQDKYTRKNAQGRRLPRLPELDGDESTTRVGEEEQDAEHKPPTTP